MSIWNTLGRGIKWGEGLLGFGKSAEASTGESTTTGGNFATGMNRNKAALEGDFDAATRSYKKGGRIPKTGVYKLHKGEEVVPAKKAKMARKMLKGL